MLRIVRQWVSQGVKIFRVDNPHTKPLDFWHWLIWEVKKTDPDVLFLAEAFTRPAMMHGAGPDRLHPVVHLLHLAHGEVGAARSTAGSWSPRPTTCGRTSSSTRRTSCTPVLQHGGPPMFKIRAVLAALLSPSWGVYSGYELFEHVPAREGAEEYLDNEKYELRPRDCDQAIREGRSLAPYLAHLNRLRSAHPALHRLRNLRFHHIDNANLLASRSATPRPATP